MHRGNINFFTLSWLQQSFRWFFGFSKQIGALPVNTDFFLPPFLVLLAYLGFSSTAFKSSIGKELFLIVVTKQRFLKINISYWVERVLYFKFTEILIMDGFGVLSNTHFLIFWCDHSIFFISLFIVTDYIKWFSNIEPALHNLDKSHLVRVDNCIYIVLQPVEAVFRISVCVLMEYWTLVFL